MAALPGIVAAARRARAEASFEFFTPAEARTVEAIAAQIIPADDLPGAREAGVVYFIDRAMKIEPPEVHELYRTGLAGLTAFASLDSKAQISALEKIEQTEFFQAVRRHTVMGFLANPEYGGNRGRVGWKLIGFPGAHAYEPPFGAYDAEASK